MMMITFLTNCPGAGKKLSSYCGAKTNLALNSQIFILFFFSILPTIVVKSMAASLLFSLLLIFLSQTHTYTSH